MNDLRWQPSTLIFTLAFCTAVPLVAAILAQSWLVALFSAPFLGALVSCTHQRTTGLGRSIMVEADHTPIRIFEGETAQLHYAINLDGPGTFEAEPELAQGMTLADPETDLPLTVAVSKWGNYPVWMRVTALSPDGAWAAESRVLIGRVHAYPLSPPQATAIPKTPLPDRIGMHLTPRRGAGVEFANTRLYQPGDPLHAINWKVSARTGRLHITERFTDRAADIVVIVDTYPQAPGAASESLTRSARGATQVTQAALQQGDRAGIVTLGSRARWITAELGRTQFYRILDVILNGGDGTNVVRGTLAPVDAVPPRAIIIAFSPMLEPQFSLALMELRRRGHPVVLVDVLAEATPFEAELDDLNAQFWRIERRRLVRDLNAVGVSVVVWNRDSDANDPDAGLAHAFRLLSRG
ncbi:DUF58 domain-containing protein [Hoyosella rhizosphaerae]|uniref:DUF58 domain-containing protein n=1 Tax=Hoyosella rhizosphaerae TaxID=1755582 RepID=A0A916XIU6_9ACTN|nr:DUF58 domain-containing protein [Hoyosella rhizosphaerae]MBN4928265.1 DUF58 domain-containing protein [Hoyosella rhizosphaerae]GGC73672.1 hypothetical protein GCM10011410_28520 [Hoyosella rhizosphaerae]